MISFTRTTLITSLATLAAILCIASCSTAYDVYLCIGQSNMAGRGDMLPGDDAVVEGVWLLDSLDRPVPATAPYNRFSTIAKRASFQAINPAWQFSKDMAESSRRKVLIVSNARGGTGLDAWQKDYVPTLNDGFGRQFGDEQKLWGTVIPQYYSEAVRRARAAMKYGKLKAIIWHQGESDISKADTYIKRLSRMVNDLRTDLKAPKVPFVVGEIYKDHAKAEVINSVLRAVPDAIPYTRCVTTEGLTSKPDNTHFDRAGQIELGHRYAEAVKDALKR